MIKTTLHNSIFFWLLQSFYQPVHLARNPIKNSFCPACYFFFCIVLLTHKILKILNCSISFKNLFGNRTCLIKIFSQHLSYVLLAPVFKCPPQVLIVNIKQNLFSSLTFVFFIFADFTIATKISPKSADISLSQHAFDILFGFIF